MQGHVMEIYINLGIEAIRVDHKVYNLPLLYKLKCIIEIEKCTPTTLTSLTFNFRVNQRKNRAIYTPRIASSTTQSEIE